MKESAHAPAADLSSPTVKEGPPDPQPATCNLLPPNAERRRPNAERPVLRVIHAGIVPYDEAVELQERLHQDRVEGRIPDTLLLLEHPPVITLGRRAHEEHLLLDRQALAQRGVEVCEAARGGDVTYHGPGQLVGYPIIDLTERGKDVHRYLRDLEEALIRALAHWGLKGERVPELTGVWVGNEKVAAIGIGVRRWVTWHGFALNVTTELDAFRMIVPCGIRDRGVTSLARLLGREVPKEEVTRTVIEAFSDVFERTPRISPRTKEMNPG